ncbi:hypothetical protein ACJA3G_13850, partial [Streptomyces sp. YS-3]
MIQARGTGGQITFDGQTVTITRKGFLRRAPHGRDENLVIFTKKQMPASEELRKALDAAITAQLAPPQA